MTRPRFGRIYLIHGPEKEIKRTNVRRFQKSSLVATVPEGGWSDSNKRFYGRGNGASGNLSETDHLRGTPRAQVQLASKLKGGEKHARSQTKGPVSEWAIMSSAKEVKHISRSVSVHVPPVRSSSSTVAIMLIIAFWHIIIIIGVLMVEGTRSRRRKEVLERFPEATLPPAHPQRYAGLSPQSCGCFILETSRPNLNSGMYPSLSAAYSLDLFLPLEADRKDAGPLNLATARKGRAR